ncbi:hypothetical protein M3M33_16390, partial [Loigolactobacillus coryniformis]|uniref:hypothetical protein n=1 Tax=Loigolactobacillus coryniformis TaxID=1610 RepID=UPI00201A46D7
SFSSSLSCPTSSSKSKSNNSHLQQQQTQNAQQFKCNSCLSTFPTQMSLNKNKKICNSNTNASQFNGDNGNNSQLVAAQIIA